MLNGERWFTFRARQVIYRFALGPKGERETINQSPGAKRKHTSSEDGWYSLSYHTNLRSIITGAGHQDLVFLEAECLANLASQIVGPEFIFSYGENRRAPGALTGAGNALTANKLDQLGDSGAGIGSSVKLGKGLSR